MHAPRSAPIIEPELLMLAYRSGIFPMSDSRDDPEIFWIEPRLRAILPLEDLRVSHSLARTLRRGRFTVTCNEAFSKVMDACAAPRRVRPEHEDTENGGSWISERIQASYENLHFLGYAHSIEVWQEGEHGRELVGGLYGVGFDRVFCGESMFSRVSDSSKVALAWLVAALRRGGASLLDCQFMTPHLASLGAVEMSQKRYLALLQRAQIGPASEPVGHWVTGSSTGSGSSGDGVTAGDALAAGEGVLPLPEAFGALMEDAASCGLASSPGKLIAQAFTQTS
ncbi:MULTISPECIES: leucyl/phenylalanyl-tRNA--protein transferase [unclassified Novosphingobium]|uniref:leucyl/phenylalanyl-tRNA--protein transferase n=1 Tax=unclassified Novosphingobium TaxID=2644732 RepID=UPI001F1AE75B|nr:MULTISPECIES: leucyl/phenylalanyl-tRNA--protein transferase [unclassified Novosphingobium]